MTTHHDTDRVFEQGIARIVEAGLGLVIVLLIAGFLMNKMGDHSLGQMLVGTGISVLLSLPFTRIGIACVMYFRRRQRWLLGMGLLTLTILAITALISWRMVSESL